MNNPESLAAPLEDVQQPETAESERIRKFQDHLRPLIGKSDDIIDWLCEAVDCEFFPKSDSRTTEMIGTAKDNMLAIEDTLLELDYVLTRRYLHSRGVGVA